MANGWGGPRANSGGARPGAGRKPKPKLPPKPLPDVARWYCVRTHRHGELTADIEIRLAGFTLFAPSLWKPAVPPRRGAGGVLRPGKPDRIVPLFPRYLFVRFRRTDPWQRIRYLPCVECFVGATSSQPAVVPDQAIDLIRGLLAPNLCLYPPTHHAAPFPVGATARLLTGPMVDLTGICTWSDGRRVRLLLEIMNRSVSVTMAQSEVEEATIG